MAKTYQNLLTESRQLLQDTDTPYRYADEILVNKLNRGLQEMGRIRPDAFWDTFVTEDIVVPEVDTAGLAQPFPLHMQFYNPLVAFVVAWAEVLDDEFTVDGRADMLIKQFKTQLLTL